MVLNDEINEIEEELNIDEIKSNLVNNVVPRPEEFGKPSRRNAYFMIPKYASAGCTPNLFFGIIPRKTTSFEKISFTPIHY